MLLFYFLGYLKHRKGTEGTNSQEVTDDHSSYQKDLANQQWKRILLLIVAITVHNIPGKEFNIIVSEYYYTIIFYL